jgi:hypothetical protein
MIKPIAFEELCSLHHCLRLTNNLSIISSINLLAPEFGIYILAHPVCKMQIIQEPKKIAL